MLNSKISPIAPPLGDLRQHLQQPPGAQADLLPPAREDRGRSQPQHGAGQPQVTKL